MLPLRGRGYVSVSLLRSATEQRACSHPALASALHAIPLALARRAKGTLKTWTRRNAGSWWCIVWAQSSRHCITIRLLTLRWGILSRPASERGERFNVQLSRHPARTETSTHAWYLSCREGVTLLTVFHPS